MKFNVLNIAAMLSIVLVMSSCNSKKEDNVTINKTETGEIVDQQSKKSAKETILFFGNSLTAGYGLQTDESFPSKIEDKIDSLGLAYKVVNAGLSGETTSGGLNRIDWVLRQSVDVFVLELGANDMLRGLPLEETKKNLIGIIQRVKNKYPTCKIVLAEMVAAPNMGEEYAKAFSKIYVDIAKSEAVAMMPFFLKDVAGKPEVILPDGKHPNADGQKIVAKYVWGYLKTKII